MLISRRGAKKQLQTHSMLWLYGDIAHALPKASLCLTAKWSEVTVSYFIRLLPLLRFPLSPITGHPAASPAAALKCLKAFSPSALLFVYLFIMLPCLSFIRSVVILFYLSFFSFYVRLVFFCLFFLLFVCSDENKCFARCLAWRLYESTIDPKTDTRPNMSTENWRKPRFLIYYIFFSQLIYIVIGFLRSHSQSILWSPCLYKVWLSLQI